MKKTGQIIRIIGILIIIMLMITTVSCGHSSGGNNNQTATENNNSNTALSGQTEQSQTTTEAKADASSVLAGLPAADYGGYEFRILTSNWFNDTLMGQQAPEEQQNGDPINDALYIRDSLVEAKYNINIKYEIIDNADQLQKKALNAIKAGDDQYDFIMDNMRIVTSGLAQNGALLDFNTIPNVDLNKEWWSKYAIRDLTINGKFYFPTGDITARFPIAHEMLLFNKKLFSDMGLDYPYKLVSDGKWTFDALKSLIKDKTRDLNGDGKFDTSDFYSMIGYKQTTLAFLRGFGESLIKVVDGNPALNVKNDKTAAMIDTLASFWRDPTYNLYTVKVYYEEVDMFTQDRAMFLESTGTNVSLYKGMDSDFGILPPPKYDANQTEYYSYCQPSASSAVGVPKTAQNTERIGTVIEALAAAGKYTSTPAVYDITLKTKYARDPESEKMLDIICAGSCYDFSYIYNWGDIFAQFITTVSAGDNFISKFDSIEGKAQAAMDKTIEAFKNS